MMGVPTQKLHVTYVSAAMICRHVLMTSAGGAVSALAAIDFGARPTDLRRTNGCLLLVVDSTNRCKALGLPRKYAVSGFRTANGARVV